MTCSLKSLLTWRTGVIAGFLIVEAIPLYAQQPKPSQIMDQYRAQRITWTTNIWPYANTLFGILATVEFAWSAAVMLLERSDLQSWTAALIRKLMWIGAFYALLLNGRTWIPAIIDSFEQIGQTSSGFNSIAPSDVFAQGIDIAGALMDAASTSAFFTNTGVCLSIVVAAALIVLAFTGICIQFIVAMVESYIVVAAGFIFLGFGGSRWTAPYTERFIGLAVSTGLKIMLLYLLIGTGMNISVTWMNDAQQVGTSTHPAMGAFEIMGAALIFLMLCWQIPKLFSAVLGGAPALTGGDLLSTGTGVVAGTAAIASVAAGGAALAARGAAALGGVSTAVGAANTGSSASSSVMSVGSAARMAGSSNGSGGGTVPPPSSPPSGPSSNGHPRQPDPPPYNGGSSGGAAAELAGSLASNGRSASRNGSGHSAMSNDNGTGDASVRSALSAVGGASLADSGFETERPAGGFTSASVRVRSNGAPSVPPPSMPVHSNASGDAGPTEVTSASAPRVVGRFANSGGVAPPIESTSAGASGNSRPVSPPNGNERSAGQTPHSAASDVNSVHSDGNRDQQPSVASGRVETIGSAARKADQALSGAANRLRGLRNQLGGLPSDAAPHTPPPRMPIDHHD
jgi:type IV secretion system protein TrbL